MEKTIAQLSEEDLILLLKRRDDLGMDVLYDKYASRIYGIIRRIIPMEDFAENVLNDSLLKIWKNIDRFDPNKGRFLTWVLNIARNAAIDEVRSKAYSKTSKLVDIEHPQFKATEPIYEVAVENLDVKDIVNKLDTKYQQVIDLIYFSGYTHVEVSKELNLPLGTVKGRVRKAFSELRNLLS